MDILKVWFHVLYGDQARLCADHVMEISCVLSLSTQTNTTLVMIIINASIWII